MRPITRGDAPKTYSRYQDAIGDLEDRLGKYCSYCERRLLIGLEVEHVSPKSRDKRRKTDWTNFLLACKNCNTVKGTKVTNDRDFLWPDKDNTLRAITYAKGGLVCVNQILTNPQKSQAESLIELVGLDRHPGQPRLKRPRKRDSRYKDREAIWALACLKREAIAKNHSSELRDAIIDLAKAEGFFGVWMSVFEEDIDMRCRLIRAFIGTSVECFDHAGRCVARPGGRL